MPANLDTLKNDLLNDHWKHAYNWAGISIRKLSERYSCSMDDVRHAMTRIAQEHPPPKSKAKVEREVSPQPSGCRDLPSTLNSEETTCKSCFAPIVWIGKHPCDPPVLKVVTADGKVHTARGSHFATCKVGAKR